MPALRYTLEGSIGIIEHLILRKKFSNHQFSANKNKNKKGSSIGKGEQETP